MQPYIRGGILEYFRSTVAELGGDTDALLREADVAPEVLTIPGIYLPYANYMKLMDSAAMATGTPHFGLLMSRSASAETLGTTGIIMTQADTVGAAWTTLAHFYRIHDTYGSVALEQTADRAIVRYGLPRNDHIGTRQVYDVAAGVSTNIMRQFCGPGFRALLMVFPYKQPRSMGDYASLMADELRFEGEALQIHFDRALWERRLPAYTAGPRSEFDTYFEEREHSGLAPASDRVEEMIRRWLPSGDCTLPFVAAALSTTSRTLQLRLEQEQSSFRQLLEKVRRDIATYHLTRGDMSLTQLAMVLGYSELSAFSRSFRQWYGISPRQWQLGEGMGSQLQ